MTKAEMIAALLAKYNTTEYYSLTVADGYPIDLNTGRTLHWYRLNLNAKGVSEIDKVPTSTQKNITFYVYNEGEVDEEAMLHERDEENAIDKDISGSDLKSRANIYSNFHLRQRVTGAVLKAAFNIINEDVGTTDHTKRLKWAVSVVNTNDLDSFVNVMMKVLQNNGTVQTSGNQVTDNDIEWIINSEIVNVYNWYHLDDITVPEV